MAKKVSGPRVEVKKNKKGEINYKIFGPNGKILIDNKQGYKRKAGVTKSLEGLQRFFKDHFNWDKVIEIK